MPEPDESKAGESTHPTGNADSSVAASVAATESDESASNPAAATISSSSDSSEPESEPEPPAQGTSTDSSKATSSAESSVLDTIAEEDEGSPATLELDDDDAATPESSKPSTSRFAFLQRKWGSKSGSNSTKGPATRKTLLGFSTNNLFGRKKETDSGDDTPEPSSPTVDGEETGESKTATQEPTILEAADVTQLPVVQELLKSRVAEETSALETQLAETKRELNDKTKTLSAQTKSNIILNTAKEALETQVQELSAELKKLQRQADVLQEQLDTVNNEKEQSDSKATELKQQLSQQKSKLDTLSQQLQQTTKQLDVGTRQLEEKTQQASEVERLRSELNEVRRQLDEVSPQLRAARNQIKSLQQELNKAPAILRKENPDLADIKDEEIRNQFPHYLRSTIASQVQQQTQSMQNLLDQQRQAMDKLLHAQVQVQLEQQSLETPIDQIRQALQEYEAYLISQLPRQLRHPALLEAINTLTALNHGPKRIADLPDMLAEYCQVLDNPNDAPSSPSDETSGPPIEIQFADQFDEESTVTKQLRESAQLYQQALLDHNQLKKQLTDPGTVVVLVDDDEKISPAIKQANKENSLDEKQKTLQRLERCLPSVLVAWLKATDDKPQQALQQHSAQLKPFAEEDKAKRQLTSSLVMKQLLIIKRCQHILDDNEQQATTRLKLFRDEFFSEDNQKILASHHHYQLSSICGVLEGVVCGTTRLTIGIVCLALCVEFFAFAKLCSHIINGLTKSTGMQSLQTDFSKRLYELCCSCLFISRGTILSAASKNILESIDGSDLSRKTQDALNEANLTDIHTKKSKAHTVASTLARQLNNGYLIASINTAGLAATMYFGFTSDLIVNIGAAGFAGIALLFLAMYIVDQYNCCNNSNDNVGCVLRTV